jgi:hypothetical protein
VLRAKAILAKELGIESVFTDELFEKWYWDRDSQPTLDLSQKILEMAARGKSLDMLIDMHLPDVQIGVIRNRLLA